MALLLNEACIAVSLSLSLSYFLSFFCMPHTFLDHHCTSGRPLHWKLNLHYNFYPYLQNDIPYQFLSQAHLTLMDGSERMKSESVWEIVTLLGVTWALSVMSLPTKWQSPRHSDSILLREKIIIPVCPLGKCVAAVDVRVLHAKICKPRTHTQQVRMLYATLAIETS